MTEIPEPSAHSGYSPHTMRFHILATDYDGTLAPEGRVMDTTLFSMERLLASGRKLVLVTGRILSDLIENFPRYELFEWIVAENGAVVHNTSTKHSHIIGQPPPDSFIELLRQKGVQEIARGDVIIATWEPYRQQVFEAIKESGLELQVILNKGAVMILPSGVNKATGLTAALELMGMSPHTVVGAGDAENDHAFLKVCELAVAVSTALPALKNAADVVTEGGPGHGIEEVIDELLRDDLERYAEKLNRHDIVLGMEPTGEAVRFPAFGSNLLIAGSSGSGKTTLATALIEQFIERGYQFCVVDPEGDYSSIEQSISIGSAKAAPDPDAVINVLEKPNQNAVVNLIGVPLPDRPAAFITLLSKVQELRARLGRPHFLIIDEAHHVLPQTWIPAATTLPQLFSQAVFITLEPRELNPQIVTTIAYAVTFGESAGLALAQFAGMRSEPAPSVPTSAPKGGHALFWRLKDRAAALIETASSQTQRKRHAKKYSEGELPEDRSFYFEGPTKKLRLRAQNLLIFLQMAEGIDEDTWMYHLRRHDYSKWFREGIKDDSLAERAHAIEMMLGISRQESVELIRDAIQERYTLPATRTLLLQPHNPPTRSDGKSQPPKQ
ncbi:MAG: HAD-IIB family hydrolase [Bdellovibrionota bacterium]